MQPVGEQAEHAAGLFGGARGEQDARETCHDVLGGYICVQNLYNLLDRTAERLLAECHTHGIAWVPFFPLGSAFATASRVTEHPTVTAAAANLAVTPGQVGLAWLLAHDPNILLIPGTRGIEHLAENMAAADVQLDAATMATLDALTPTATDQ